MKGEEGHRGDFSDNNSDTESIIGGGGSSSDRVGFSGPLVSAIKHKKGSYSKKSARFNLPQETTNFIGGDDYVEITLDIRDHSVAVQSVQGAATASDNEDPELVLLAKRALEGKSKSQSTSLGSLLFRNTSFQIRQVSPQELKHSVLSSTSRRHSSSARRFDRTKSAAAHALKGLKFITTKTDASGNEWYAIEKRFDDLTTNGLLPSSMFGECIGMNRESKEFAAELFRALARRYNNVMGDSINKAQLRDFWEQISDQSFDSRLQISLTCT